MIWTPHLYLISSQSCHNRAPLLMMMILFQPLLRALVPSGVPFVVRSRAVETSACLYTMLYKAVNYLTSCTAVCHYQQHQYTYLANLAGGLPLKHHMWLYEIWLADWIHGWWPTPDGFTEPYVIHSLPSPCGSFSRSGGATQCITRSISQYPSPL